MIHETSLFVVVVVVKAQELYGISYVYSAVAVCVCVVAGEGGNCRHFNHRYLIRQNTCHLICSIWS